MRQIERVLPQRGVRGAESSPREVVGQSPPRLIIGVDHQEKRVIPIFP